MKHVSAGVGHADASDATEAGRKAAAEAAEAVADPTLAYVFSTSEYDYDALLKGVDDVIDATVVGSSTAGEIVNTDSYTESVAVLVLGGDGIGRATSGVGHYDRGDREAGRAAVREALDGFGRDSVSSVVHEESRDGWQSFPKVAGSMFGSTFPDRAAVVDGVTDIADPLPVHGAWAADDWKYDNLDAVFRGREAFGSAVVFSALEVDVRVGVGVAHGLEKSGEQFRVTEIEDDEVREIENRPAHEFYKDKFGPEMGTDQALITRPVGADLGADEPRIVVPFESNPDTGGLKFAGIGNLTEGMTVSVIDPTPEAVHHGAGMAIDKALADAGDPDDIAAVVLHDCLCRWFHMSDVETREHELDIVRDRVGDDVPIVGWYTGGEIAYPDPLGGVHDQTMVAWVITNESI